MTREWTIVKQLRCCNIYTISYLERIITTVISNQSLLSITIHLGQESTALKDDNTKKRTKFKEFFNEFFYSPANFKAIYDKLITSTPPLVVVVY